MEKIVEIFWTGGYDSTFRMCQLSRMNVVVQPYYLSDNRQSEKNELEAIDKIYHRLINDNATKAKLLPIIYISVSDRIKNERIEKSFQSLLCKAFMGSQYAWLGAFAKLHKGIELSIHLDDKAISVINQFGALKLEEGDCGPYYIVDQEKSSKEVIDVFGNEHFPLVEYSKLKMKAEYIAMGLEDVINDTWFCHRPINGKPCGCCNPCKYTIEEGMIERMPEEAIKRYQEYISVFDTMNHGKLDFKKLMKLPRDVAHGLLYRAVKGRELNLEEPHDLNEKLQWLMVNKYDKNVSTFADKLAVRDYVRSCGYGDGEDSILTELYGVYEHSSQIDEKKLPEQFVIKCNHGSGPLFYSLCTDRSNYDYRAEFAKFDRAMELNYAYAGLEYHYNYIKPYIFAEEMIGENCIDYKFFCFGGKAHYVKVISDRASEGKHQDYYDMDFNFCPFVKEENSMHNSVKKPENFTKMIEIAEKLSAPFPCVRVDLYNVKGKIYFGEITLTPATGLNRTDKQETLDLFGDLTDLTYFREELLLFPRTGEIEELLSKNDLISTRCNKKSNDRYSINDIKNLDELQDGDISQDGMNSGSINNEKLNSELLVQLNKNADRILAAPDILYTVDKDTANGIMADCSKIMGSDAENTLKEKYMSILYYIAFREDMSLEECWQIFWSINRLLFVNFKLKLLPAKVNGDGYVACEPALEILYRYIFEFVMANINYEKMPYRSENQRNKDTVVVVTSQFLKVGHAPTQRVLDYSYAMTKLGKKVIIINDAGMHYYEAEHLKGVVTFNFLEEHNSKSRISYKDTSFEFLQISSLMPDISVLQQLVEAIYDINPILVYNIGSACLTSDLCTPFVSTCSLICSYNLPITTGRYLLLGRDIEESIDGKKLEMLMEHQEVVVTNYNFKIRESSRVYTREQFGIPEEAFVLCTIGYRLGMEIDNEFAKVMGKLAGLDSSIYVVLIGDVDSAERERILSCIPDECRGRIIFTGGLTDASEMTRKCDMYINPDRSGGGRSAFEGLKYGVPMVSLRRGDAYFAGGKICGADDYDEYVELVKKCFMDKEYYSYRKQEAVERAEKLSNIEQTIDSQLAAMSVK